jgi:hypothetical protein
MPTINSEKVKKFVILCIAFVAIFFFLGKELNPLELNTFLIHDNTQAARMQEFALNLKNGIIPPRLAPNFSFQHGFPVFNFYAPFSYWVGALIHLTGIPSAVALKLMLFLGLFISFISFFLFASLFFGYWGGLLGATIYSSSLWMAVEIFVRGNVGEIWFMALLPLGLYLLKKNDEQKHGIFFLLTSISLSFLFTVHNVLSLVFMIFVILFSFLLKHKRKALMAVLVGLLLASYFLIPALLENKLTYANEIASKTKYEDHFLCAWQLWKADKWSYGGSGIGCVNDDMSFQIGKAQLIIAGVGLLLFFFTLKKQRKEVPLTIPLFILGWTVLSAFLTIYASQPIWDLFSPIMAVFQYPWRFLVFVVFGTAFFASYVIYITKNNKAQIAIVVILSISVLFISSKFFSRPWKYSIDEYTNLYVSEKYINQKAAYEIPEYFPRSGDYATWRLYDKSQVGFYKNPINYKINSPFYKEILTDQNQITLPIHYFPFWEIQINRKTITPHFFDKLGRPILTGLSDHSTVIVRYNETPTEKAGNAITLVTFGLLIIVSLNKRLWKKMNTILQ